MPFEMEVDGPYFSVLDFFAQTGPALANHQRRRFEIERYRRKHGRAAIPDHAGNHGDRHDDRNHLFQQARRRAAAASSNEDRGAG